MYKKIIIYIISFIFICFIIPALLTKRTIPANSEEKENISQGNEQETNKNQENSRTFKPLDEQQYKSKTKSDVLTIFAILCFIFVLLSLIIFGTFSFINLTSTKIAKGVYIKGIDVSGLTKEDATKKISSYVSSSIPEEIKLKHNDFETSLSTSQLSIYFNTEEAVNMAYNIGKNGNIFQKNNITIFNILLT